MEENNIKNNIIYINKSLEETFKSLQLYLEKKKNELEDFKLTIVKLNLSLTLLKEKMDKYYNKFLKISSKINVLITNDNKLNSDESSKQLIVIDYIQLIEKEIIKKNSEKNILEKKVENKNEEIKLIEKEIDKCTKGNNTKLLEISKYYYMYNIMLNDFSNIIRSISEMKERNDINYFLNYLINYFDELNNLSDSEKIKGNNEYINLFNVNKFNEKYLLELYVSELKDSNLIKSSSINKVSNISLEEKELKDIISEFEKDYKDNIDK
jgi:hypothetical protein